MFTLASLIAFACLLWYIFIVIVQIIGVLQICKGYSRRPLPASSSGLADEEIPHVTILRPVKGFEPWLYECLSSTFRLDYPASKLTLSLCVASRKDPAFPLLEQLLADFPGYDVKIFVEAEDNMETSIRDLQPDTRGPNPKIRNMSRAYREAPSDIIWILDCNVWVGRGTAGRMVDKLCGYSPHGARAEPYRFVHQLPVVIEANCNAGGVFETAHTSQQPSRIVSSKISPVSNLKGMSAQNRRTNGGRLEEMFMATSHAKFYSGITTIAVAPCVVGKSNMFRRSHLNLLTAASSSSKPGGIDFFSHNICEDQLIGTMLWRKTSPVDQPGQRWKNHALLSGDMAIQPVAEMSVGQYIARRVRWQRVRKFTTMVATIIEPGAESLLCSAIGAFAITTLPFFQSKFCVPQTWAAFAVIWSIGIFVWITTDWHIYKKLHSYASVEVDANTPAFALPPERLQRRSLGDWMIAWVCRELLAFPIWCTAVCGGSTVVWRSKKFRVGMDMMIHEIPTQGSLSI